MGRIDSADFVPLALHLQHPDSESLRQTRVLSLSEGACLIRQGRAKRQKKVPVAPPAQIPFIHRGGTGEAQGISIFTLTRPPSDRV